MAPQLEAPKTNAHPLRRERRLRDATQRDLAEFVGCSREYVSQVERRVCRPSAHFRREASAALGLAEGLVFGHG